MKVRFSVKAEELRSSANIELTLGSDLYNHAVHRINELAKELKAMHDKSVAEDKAYREQQAKEKQ